MPHGPPDCIRSGNSHLDSMHRGHHWLSATSVPTSPAEALREMLAQLGHQSIEEPGPLHIGFLAPSDGRTSVGLRFQPLIGAPETRNNPHRRARTQEREADDDHHLPMKDSMVCHGGLRRLRVGRSRFLRRSRSLHLLAWIQRRRQLQAPGPLLRENRGREPGEYSQRAQPEAYGPKCP